MSERPDPRHSGWGAADVIAVLGLTLLAGAMRLWHVARPPTVVFDETYYAKDACWYVLSSSSVCGTAAEQTTVHPPLGKWLIAAGIRVFGYNSLGWRIASVIAGAITVTLLYVLARKLLRSTLGALVAAGLFAFDPLHFVQSRTAMLDVFVCLFGVAAFVCVTQDRDAITRGARASVGWGLASGRRAPLARPWRTAAGIAGGAATASKWSGALLVLAVLVLTVTWEIAARRAEGSAGAIRRAFVSEAPSVLAYLVLLPVVVYGLSYAGRLDGTLLAAPWSPGSWAQQLVDRQLEMLSFHEGLEATHSYQSPAWSWPLLKRPVSYYFDTAPNGDYKEILATGNPWAWWLGLAALGFVLLRWLRWRDYARPEGLILAGFLFPWAPWLLPALSRSAIFLFYLLPSLPFMYLALGYGAVMLARSLLGRATVAVASAVAIVLFGFYYPLLANVALPYEQWENRLWIFDNCDKPPGKPVTSRVTETVAGEVRTSETVGNTSDDLPPAGWCWR